MASCIAGTDSRKAIDICAFDETSTINHRRPNISRNVIFTEKQFREQLRQSQLAKDISDVLKRTDQAFIYVNAYSNK